MEVGMLPLLPSASRPDTSEQEDIAMRGQGAACNSRYLDKGNYSGDCPDITIQLLRLSKTSSLKKDSLVVTEIGVIYTRYFSCCKHLIAIYSCSHDVFT